MRVPPLETDRLLIREFALHDLGAIRRLLDGQPTTAGAESAGTPQDERESWLRWTVLAYQELARLHQFPYGDRAIALGATGEVIGACGFAPLLGPFARIPGLGRAGGSPDTAYLPEVGLYWAVSPEYQRHGYATEAARALVAYAFCVLNVGRILATTTYDNRASIAVMRKLGMRIECNPHSVPPWLQIVGILPAPGDAPSRT